MCETASTPKITTFNSFGIFLVKFAIRPSTTGSMCTKAWTSTILLTALFPNVEFDDCSSQVIARWWWMFGTFVALLNEMGWHSLDSLNIYNLQNYEHYQNGKTNKFVLA